MLRRSQAQPRRRRTLALWIFSLSVLRRIGGSLIAGARFAPAGAWPDVRLICIDHAGQEVEKDVSFFHIEAGKEAFLRDEGARPQPSSQLFSSRREPQHPSAPVTSVRSSFDEPLELQLIDERSE